MKSHQLNYLDLGDAEILCLHVWKFGYMNPVNLLVRLLLGNDNCVIPFYGLIIDKSKNNND